MTTRGTCRTTSSVLVSAMMLLLMMTIGCTSTTRVSFNGPPGSVLYIDDKPHHLPATVGLTRPSGSSGSLRHDAGLVFTPSGQSSSVRAKGYIDVFGYTQSDVDKVAVNTCNLDESQLLKIADGTTVIFRGESASRQPLYDLTLGKK